MIKAVIFDFDGTLADTEPYHSATRLRLLNELGAEVDNKRFVGISLRTFWGGVVERNGLSVSGEELTKRNLYEVAKEVKAVGMKPNDGAEEMLATLKKSYALAVASSSDRDYVDDLLSYFKLEKYFSCSVCGDEVVNLKPAPDIYLKACALLGVNVQEAVAVEDSDVGMQAAKAAGLKCIGYRAENASVKQSFAYSDFTVDELRDIPAVIEAINKKGDDR